MMRSETGHTRRDKCCSIYVYEYEVLRGVKLLRRVEGGAGAAGGTGSGSYETEFCLGRENVPVTDGGRLQNSATVLDAPELWA